MIQRNVVGRKARAVFYRHLNDFDVYVEDASAETRKLITTLLTNSSNGKYLVSNVFPLGPRAAVIGACLADQVPGGRPRVYMIDGDLDLCVSSVQECVQRLFVLRRYCIENFLVDSHAAANVVANNSLTRGVESARKDLKFDEWLANNAVALRRVFLAYAAVRMLNPTIRTVSLPLGELLSDDSGMVDDVRVEQRIEELRKKVDATCSAGSFDECFSWLNDVHSGCPKIFSLSKVSGKDYLLPLLRLRMSKVEKIGRPANLLKLDLAAHVFSEELGELAGRAGL